MQNFRTLLDKDFNQVSTCAFVPLRAMLSGKGAKAQVLGM
jgi:hypothetical protein